MGWLSAWYTKHLKEWAETYLAELAKGVLVLFGLAVFRVGILALRLMGMAEEQLRLLEELHFWLQYATIAVLGGYSVLKLIGGMM